jgi:hypothetical protein
MLIAVYFVRGSGLNHIERRLPSCCIPILKPPFGWQRLTQRQFLVAELAF